MQRFGKATQVLAKCSLYRTRKGCLRRSYIQKVRESDVASIMEIKNCWMKVTPSTMQSKSQNLA